MVVGIRVVMVCLQTGEYEVDDPTNPKNEYGKAKLAGEKAIQAAVTDYYVSTP